MYYGFSQNDKIFSEILNLSSYMKNQIDLIWNSRFSFINDKELIAFCYLLGYFTSKSKKSFNKENTLDSILQFSTTIKNNEEDISDIIMNLSFIFNDYIKEDNIENNNNNFLFFNNNNNEKNININKYNTIKENKNIFQINKNISPTKENENKNKKEIQNQIELNENIINHSDDENSINKEMKEIKNKKNSNNINLMNMNKIKINVNNNDNKINNNININENENELFSNNKNNKNEITILGKKTLFPKKIKNMIQCKICLEDFDENDNLNYELECGCIIHYECFDEYISDSIENNNIPILCPYCKIEIHPNIIYESLHIKNNINLIEKYEKFSMNDYISNNKDNYSCCPTAGCEYIFYFEKGENRFLCPLCNKEYCLFCKDIWHKGMTCQEFQDTKDVKKMDDKFMNFVKGQNYKICPICGVWVSKTYGCDNMKCKCGNNFCYKCGKVIPKKTHNCSCWGKYFWNA